MECNKEEAIRAKEIAEKKMQNKDFVGARKIVLKAQQLYPDLENISQMLTVCDVHCSAERKMLGWSEMDWYGILQIEQTADEVSIKKQYRKLALLLHPDKNKFAGAEAAFKLIGEAQRALSDKAKRSIYDMKYGASQRTTVPKQQRQQNRNSYVRKQPGVHNNFVNTTQFTNLNPQKKQSQQQTRPGFSNGQQTFWTACPFCNVRYQYYRDIVNRALRCQNCMKPFIAYDVDAQGVPVGASCSQSAFPHQKEVLSQGGPQSNVENFPSNIGFQGNFGSGATASEPFLKTESTSGVGGGFKTKVEEDGDVDMEVGNKGKKRPKFEEEKPKEGKPSGNMSRNRGRKADLESSDSCDTGSSADTEEISRNRGRKPELESSDSCDTGSSADTEENEVIEQDSGLPAGQNSGFTRGCYPRRSARQKQHISYDEHLSDDDDFVSPPKRSRGSGSSDATEEQSDEASLEGEASKTNEPADFTAIFEEDKKVEKQEGSVPLEESLPNGNDEAEECKTNGKEAAVVDDNKERFKVDNKSKSNLGPKPEPEPEFFDVPDPDFYDFDKDRKEECFAVDQIWAVYDTADGMPRFYARIRKVFSPGFKVRITWLEADPDDQDEIDWFSEDLPVACGKFKQDESEDTEDLGMFSHLVFWGKGTGRGSYKIYPRKGETWALFKNWDIKWSSDPDNHRNYAFEFVEVLSDYAEGSGISVAYLVKVTGFVSLFRQTTRKGIDSFQIPPNELFRFSHNVPSFRTTGTEREDVPEGYFELDPASLPDDPRKIADPEDVKVSIESMDANVNGSCSKSQAEEVKPMTGSGRTSTLKKSIYPDEKNTQDRGNSKGGKQSPRELNWGHKEKPSQANASRCVAKEETGKHLGHVKDSNHDVTSGEASASKCQADVKERNIDGMETSSSIVAEDQSPSPASFLEGSDVPEPKFYNFGADKYQKKFQPGQIWALYCELDELPKYYVQIDRIESRPDFKLHVTWLEACPPPKDTIQWFNKDMPICCGTFKLEIDETKVFTDTGSFSHQVRAEPTGKKKKYAIYPRKGEVWALYKNFNSEWTCSDLKKCEYDMVEVLEDNGLVRKVLVLEQVDGFQTVFKAQSRGSAVTMEIPHLELLRFSHQVPAFRLTEERGGSLRDCWELDPASLPVLFFCSI